MTCTGTSSRVKALAAVAPDNVVEVVKDGMAYLLSPDEEITVGSPAIASPTNPGPIDVQILDGTGAVIGTFALDPGEAVDVVRPSSDSVQLTVLTGSIDVTIGGTTSTLGAGQTGTFSAITPGRMHGEGKIDLGSLQHHFTFHVLERATGADRGRLRYQRRQVQGRRDQIDRFASTALTSVVFSDQPGLRPGQRAVSDTVMFAGTGEWNGVGGHSFEATAVDAGEPGRRRGDRMTLTIRAPGGAVVASVDGMLTHGNIQAVRMPR